MRSAQRKPFSVKVTAPSTGLNTRVPRLGSGALANYGAYGESAAGLSSQVALRDAVFCSNMRFEDGVACNSPGYEAVTMTPTPDGPINLIAQANLSSQLVSISTRSPIIGTTKSLYAQNSPGLGYLKVFAGSDQTILNASTATLAATFLDTFGTGSNTPAFLWTQVSGPAAMITSPTAQSTGITQLAPGVSVFQIRASDSGTNATSTVQITVLYTTRPYAFTTDLQVQVPLAEPSNGYIYLSTQSPVGMFSNKVEVYNPRTNSIVASISGFSPTGDGYTVLSQAVYNPVDGFIYIWTQPQSFGGTYSGILTKIDPNTNTIVRTLTLPASFGYARNSNRTGMVMAGNKIVFTGTYEISGHGAFVVVDPVTFTVGTIFVIPDAYDLYGLCYNSSNGLCYSLNGLSGANNYLYSFDPVAGTVTKIDTGVAVSHELVSITYCSLDNALYMGMQSGSPNCSLGRWDLGSSTLTFIGGSLLNVGQVMYEPLNKKVYFLTTISGTSVKVCYYDPVSQAITITALTFNFYTQLPGFYTGMVAYSTVYNSLYAPAPTVGLNIANAP